MRRIFGTGAEHHVTLSATDSSRSGYDKFRNPAGASLPLFFASVVLQTSESEVVWYRLAGQLVHGAEKITAMMSGGRGKGLLLGYLKQLDERVNVKLLLQAWGPRFEFVVRLLVVATFPR